MRHCPLRNNISCICSAIIIFKQTTIVCLLLLRRYLYFHNHKTMTNIEHFDSSCEFDSIKIHEAKHFTVVVVYIFLYMASELNMLFPIFFPNVFPFYSERGKKSKYQRNKIWCVCKCCFYVSLTIATSTIFHFHSSHYVEELKNTSIVLYATHNSTLSATTETEYVLNDCPFCFTFRFNIEYKHLDGSA